MAIYGLTLDRLRSEFLDLVDDPEGDVFAPGGQYGRADRLLNRAYIFLVNQLEQSGQVYNRSSDPIEVPVVPDYWDYDLNRDTPIRRIIEVVIRGEDGLDVPVEMTTYANRLAKTSETDPYRTILRPRQHVVYVYRLATGGWRLSFTANPQESRSFYVHWSPMVAALESGGDEPRHLPQQWHHLIALRAAWTGMGTEKRENTDAAREYLEMLGQFVQETSGLLAPVKSRPI